MTGSPVRFSGMAGSEDRKFGIFGNILKINTRLGRLCARSCVEMFPCVGETSLHSLRTQTHRFRGGRTGRGGRRTRGGRSAFLGFCEKKSEGDRVSETTARRNSKCGELIKSLFAIM